MQIFAISLNSSCLLNMVWETGVHIIHHKQDSKLLHEYNTVIQAYVSNTFQN